MKKKVSAALKWQGYITPSHYFFYFSPLCIFLGEKYIFKRKQQEISSWLSSGEIPPRSHFFLFCSASQSIQTVFAQCLCPCKFTVMCVNLFNNSSPMQWLFLFSKATPHIWWGDPFCSCWSEEFTIDWISLHMLLLRFVDISRAEYFKARIFSSFWMVLRWKQKMLHLVRVNYISNLLQLIWLGL